MEDGVKGDPGQPKESRFLSKAGWVKKASGRFLAIYKDRYVHVEKTEVVVYENEDLKTCLQRLDLEHFEKCLELKSFFKNRNRFILIREPICANKIQDVKFQAQTPEEKDSWIKALTEGINRAKNKIFDEVKVDESNNLDHVTRTRPKGNRGRRPPTRIHMKEVANVSSEGILGLNLDEKDAGFPNGTNCANKDPPKKCQTPPMPLSGTSSSTEEMQSSSPELEEPETVVEPKKVFKPPMPPSKDIKDILAAENGPSAEADPEKVPGPPKPPSKQLKPSVSTAEEDVEDLSEGGPAGPGAEEKTDPAVAPPTEPMSSPTDDGPAAGPWPAQEASPPAVPPKDKKPGKDPERGGSPSTSEDPRDEIAVKVSEVDQSSAPPAVQKPEEEDASTSPSAEERPKVLDVTPEPISTSTPSGPADAPSSNKVQVQWQSDPTTLPTPDTPSLETTRQCPSPIPSLKKKPLKMLPPKPLSPAKLPQPEDQPTVSADPVVTQPEDSSSSETEPSVCPTHMEDSPEPAAESHQDIPTVVLTLSEPEAQRATSERSICHSECDSVDSGSEDTLASSTFALQGSQVGLDSVYASDDDSEDYNNPEQIRDAAPPGTTISQVSSGVEINRVREKPKVGPRPPVPLRPIFKTMSASVGDLLSDISEETRDSGDGLSEVKSLERGIALGLEQTKELLSSTAQTQGEGLGKNMPEDLLAKAMEKLRMADHFLREAKTIGESKRQSRNNRSSW